MKKWAGSISPLYSSSIDFSKRTSLSSLTIGIESKSSHPTRWFEGIEGIGGREKDEWSESFISFVLEQGEELARGGVKKSTGMADLVLAAVLVLTFGGGRAKGSLGTSSLEKVEFGEDEERMGCGGMF